MTVPGARRVAPAAVAALVLLTTACAGARVPSAPEAPGPHTAVTPRQAVQILSAVDATLVRAVQSRDATRLEGRAVGPVQAALTAAIRVQAALKLAPSVPPSPTTPRLMLTLAGPWPRWFAVAGPSPAASTPLLEVLSSPDARSPYGLWGQLRLLPGAVLPEVASATAGARTLEPGATGLAASPADTVNHYAELLNRGDASSFTSQFSTDAYRTELNAQLAADRRDFQSRGVGQVTAVHSVAGDPPLAMPTLDGGALVIGRVDQQYTATVTAGRGSVRLDQQLAVLAGRPTVSSQLERRSVEVFAFHVPRAGSSDKITLVAASRSDVSATGS